jgi:hypothetical protein
MRQPANFPATGRLQKTLLVVGLGLVGVIAYEAVSGSSDRSGRYDSPVSQAESGAAQSGGPISAYEAILLGRPLFSADRRGPPADAAQGGAGYPADMPRLTGLVILPGARMATFEVPGKGRLVVTGEGDRIGRWRVRQIAPDSVNLEGADGTFRLEPSFDARTASIARALPPLPSASRSNEVLSADPKKLEDFYKESLARKGAKPQTSQ